MLKGLPFAQAQTAASKALWKETLDRAVPLPISYVSPSLDAGRNTPLAQEQGNEGKGYTDAEYMEWLKSIGAENTELNTIEKFEEAKYNHSEEYQLLTGYRYAIEKGDISPLVGFDLYKSTNDDIQSTVVGQTTSTGVEIKSFCTHFIDRVIGQSSSPHRGMRQGIPVSSLLDALQHPEDLDPVEYTKDGDIRQTFHGNGVSVTISIRDGRLIQANPWKGKK